MGSKTAGLSADVIVVGAGVAGVMAAAVLQRQGKRVLLLDARAACPPVFKAEKIEREPLRMLADLGLLASLLPQAGQIFEVCAAYDGRVFKRQALQQVGITYADMVNTLRAQLPAEVSIKLGRAESIVHNKDTARVTLAGGEELRARLVVLACGVNGQLLAQLGLRRQMIRKEQSIAFGFYVTAANGRAFPFQAVTYYPGDSSNGIDYLTLFKIRQSMRANLFMFRSLSDEWTREFHREPRLLLERALPELPNVIGEYHVTGKIEAARSDLYCTEGSMPDGVLLIGDAHQSVCPATGLGLKKIATDIKVLAGVAPGWFATAGMSAHKLREFYDDPRKRAMDAFVLQNAEEHRLAVTGTTLRWRTRRALVRAKWSLSRPRSGFAYPATAFEHA